MHGREGASLRLDGTGGGFPFVENLYELGSEALDGLGLGNGSGLAVKGAADFHILAGRGDILGNLIVEQVLVETGHDKQSSLEAANTLVLTGNRRGSPVVYCTRAIGVSTEVGPLEPVFVGRISLFAVDEVADEIEGYDILAELTTVAFAFIVSRPRSSLWGKEWRTPSSLHRKGSLYPERQRRTYWSCCR